MKRQSFSWLGLALLGCVGISACGDDASSAGAAAGGDASDAGANGSIDLVVSDNSDSGLTLLRNDGKGRFSKTRRYRAGAQPFGMVSADFDADGHADLAVANVVGKNFSILLSSCPAP